MTFERLAQRLRELSPRGVQVDQPLAPLTTYRLGGPAQVLFEPMSREELAGLPRALADAGMGPDEIDVLVIGRGSNLVISDHGFDGLVIRLGSAVSWIRAAGAGGTIEAGGGTSLPQVANWAARRSLSGLEFGVGIPGSVGGGVRMNAGAHGGAISDTLRTVELLTLWEEGSTQRAAADLELSYRRSSLTDGEVVVSASLDLLEDDPATIKGRMDAYRRHRLETQPGALQNAGSTFKNPPGDAAGRLVEAAGLKGHSVGGARVSDLHANFFIAPEGTRAQDVFDLVHDVKLRVWDRFGVDLEPEVRFVGPFDESRSRLSVAR